MGKAAPVQPPTPSMATNVEHSRRDVWQPPRRIGWATANFESGVLLFGVLAITLVLLHWLG